MSNLRLFCLVLLFGAVMCGAEPIRWSQSGFDSSPDGWTRWAPREEIAPRAFLETSVSRGQPNSLAVAADGNAAAFGGWQYTLSGIQPRVFYRFLAHYRCERVAQESLQILARLDWLSASGKRVSQPEHPWLVSRDGAWRRLSMEVPAPEDAAAVKIQLFLRNAPNATVWWDDLSFHEIPDPGPRNVRIASVNLRPRQTGSAQASVDRFLQLIGSSVSAADIILLPEGITMIGTGKSFPEVAESVPGPTTARLAEMARRKRAYIAAGIYERDGTAIYNTAVLLDREGNLAGKYRKVYLPREELEGGLTPGSSYPVFPTDFGKVGMMICWDVQFADPARHLALQGAEILLVPIWGGDLSLAKARAIENRVFLVSSGYDYPTHIMDPNGEILSQAASDGSIAYSVIDLNRRYLDRWLGDMRARFHKEVRLDLP
ncbi:MAG: carbon-nitrogen hydrolase family protein [Acidimicrobiia bacterium]|nr:carbon-nitrogen hydrolase family protein [Acidimicrobiia bacterium]